MAGNNYSFVIDNTFNPFNMQEMLVPFTAYKSEFEKAEAMYEDLSDRSDKFKYLSDTLPDGSKARQIYEGYANDLREQAEDLAHNGLTMTNRKALTSLKRRYQGEMGRVLQADEAMREEKKMRRNLLAQDSSLLYAQDNLNIDDFLDGNTPNLYSISGNELYTRGAAAGKAASSRVFSAGDAGSTLNGYYRDYVQRLGYSRETIQKFYQDMSTIPELQQAADAILEERGVNQNLTGYNLRRARQSVINGMIDGAIYQENHTPLRDLGVLTKAEEQQMELQRRGQDISLASQGLTYDPKTRTVSYDYTKDPSLQRASAIATIKAQASGSKGNSRTSAYDTRNKQLTMVGASTGTKYRNKDDKDENRGFGQNIDMNHARALTSQELDALTDNYGNIRNGYLKSTIGNGNISDYEVYIIPKDTDDNDEDVYIVIPRDSKRSATDSSSYSGTDSNSGTNDIPAR